MEVIMDREEILKRSRMENRDEGSEYVDMKSRWLGEIGLCVFFSLILLYKAVKGLEYSDCIAMLMGYLGAAFLYKYLKRRSVIDLIGTIFAIFAAVAHAVLFVVKTW